MACAFKLGQLHQQSDVPKRERGGEGWGRSGRAEKRDEERGEAGKEKGMVGLSGRGRG